MPMSKRKSRKKNKAVAKGSQQKVQPVHSDPQTTENPGSAKSKRQAKQEQRQSRQRNRRTGLAVVAVLLVTSLAVVFVIQNQTSRAARATAPPLDLPDPSIGSDIAPVTIVEYGDFGCPSCLS